MSEHLALSASRRRRAFILATCSLSLFIVSLDGTIVNVGLPSIERGFHADVSGLQWVVDSYLLVLASFLLVSGSTGDRIGRRRVFQTGLVIFTAGSLLCSLAPDLRLLIAFRMLQAVGGSMLNPNSLSIVSNTFTDARERAVAIGVWGGVFGISAACGPILGGLLVVSVGWRAIFWVNVPVGIATFVLARHFVPESRAKKARPVDVPGQLAMIVFLASLTYAIIEGPTHGWASRTIVGLFALAIVSLGAFVALERRSPSPLLDTRFFRSPPFSGAAAIATAAFMVLAGFLFLNTLYLQEARGDSALVAGLMTLPATAVVAVAAPVAGRIVGRWGPRWPLAAAGLFMAGGALVLSSVRLNTPYRELAGGYVLLGLGFGLVNPPITNTAVAGMPRAQSGTAAAVASASRQVGNVLGVAVMGALATARFAGSLALRLNGLGLSPSERRLLLGGGIATGTTSAGGSLSHRASILVRSTFALSTHIGWDVAIACGALITIVALLTTSERARAVATSVGREMDVEDADTHGTLTVGIPAD